MITRQERREQKRNKRMEMRTHGANLATLYRNSVIKSMKKALKNKGVKNVD